MRGKRKGGGSMRAKLYPFQDSVFPPHWGCQHPPVTPKPLPTEPHRTASAPLPPSGFSFSSPPPLRPRPRTQPGSSSFGRVSAADPPARPPASAKVFSTRRRKDAGPGLPGSSRAYLKGGRGLDSQPSGWTEPQRGRRARRK